jgi:hypothetical protein
MEEDGEIKAEDGRGESERYGLRPQLGGTRLLIGCPLHHGRPTDTNDLMG